MHAAPLVFDALRFSAMCTFLVIPLQTLSHLCDAHFGTFGDPSVCLCNMSMRGHAAGL
jgi:hypothetical protein